VAHYRWNLYLHRVLSACVFTFVAVGGYWAELLRIRVSTRDKFSADVWIGLLAAALVASVGIEFLAYVLTANWKNSLSLLGGGWRRIGSCDIHNQPAAHHYCRSWASCCRRRRAFLCCRRGTNLDDHRAGGAGPDACTISQTGTTETLKFTGKERDADLASTIWG